MRQALPTSVSVRLRLRAAFLPVLLAALLPVLFSASPASARVVEVSWAPGDGQAGPTTRDQAREAAFRRAVYAEIMELLPGAPGEYRAELLREHFAPLAGEYVLSYSEAESLPAAPPPAASAPAAPGAEGAAAPGAASPDGEPIPGPADQGATPPRDGAAPPASVVVPAPAPVPSLLRLDVTVNRAALKKALKRLGVFYTLSESQPFDLGLTGQASGAWADIGRLQVLTGVRVIRDAEPFLEIGAELVEPSEEERKAGLKEAALLWSATLFAQGKQWTASGRGLDGVWNTVWAGWFSRPEAEAGMVDDLAVTVSGWYASDGIKAFADELAAWENTVEEAQLREVRMLPEGMAAVFDVRTLDRAALAGRLDEALAQRGLRWEFGEGTD